MPRRLVRCGLLSAAGLPFFFFVLGSSGSSPKETVDAWMQGNSCNHTTTNVGEPLPFPGYPIRTKGIRDAICLVNQKSGGGEGDNQTFLAAVLGPCGNPSRHSIRI